LRDLRQDLAQWHTRWLTCFDEATLLGVAALTEPSAVLLHPEIARSGLPELVFALRQLCSCPVLLVHIAGQPDARQCGADGELNFSSIGAVDSNTEGAPPALPPLGADGFTPRESELCWSALRLDARTRSAYWRDQLLAASDLQFRLLWALGAARGGVVGFAELTRAVYDDRGGADRGRIQAHVRRVRLLIEPNPARPAFLLTVWGRGFRLAE
jgi:Transcriptional regulatory protein, C terminal